MTCSREAHGAKGPRRRRVGRCRRDPLPWPLPLPSRRAGPPGRAGEGGFVCAVAGAACPAVRVLGSCHGSWLALLQQWSVRMLRSNVQIPKQPMKLKTRNLHSVAERSVKYGSMVRVAHRRSSARGERKRIRMRVRTHGTAYAPRSSREKARNTGTPNHSPASASQHSAIATHRHRCGSRGAAQRACHANNICLDMPPSASTARLVLHCRPTRVSM